MEKTVVPDSVNDSGWVFDPTTSLPHRGIYDYTRVVTFKEKLSDSELQELYNWLQTHNCPGWTPIHAREECLFPESIGRKYTFYTTMDSSD